MDKGEVEREVKLVARPIETTHGSHVKDVGLAEKDTRRLVAVGQLPPAAEHVVDFGSFHVVDAALAKVANRRRIVPGRDGVVAQFAVLDDGVSDVDAEAGDAAVVPEAVDLIKGIADFGIPPIQVRLLGKEVVEVILPGGNVERPRWPAEDTQPVVRRTPIRFTVCPNVPISVFGLPGGARVEEPSVLVAAVIG